MRYPNNRDEYVNAEVSEKITLAHVSAASSVYNFDNPSTNIYTKLTSYVVVSVKDFNQAVNSSVGINEWFFDVPSKTLYIGTDQDITTTSIVVTYRLFFSDAPVNTTWNLENNQQEVEYEARIIEAPQFKSEVGVNQNGSSLTNSGNLVLENNDGYFDDIFDFLVFENKEVTVYSWNRYLDPNEKQILFKGNIYNKSFSSEKISLQVKNSFTRVDESVILTPYTTLDNVSSKYLNQYKRLIYGRVNELLVRSIDQVGDGYQLTGTISTNIGADANVTGNGTLFTSELLVNDKIEIDSQEFNVESISNNTTMVISSSSPIYTRGNETSYEKITETTLTGTVSANIFNLKQVVGLGTLFTSELSNGDTIKIKGKRYKISSIINNELLILDTDLVELFQSSTFTKYETSSLTGTLTFTPPARTITGSGTLFLDETSPGDEITFNDRVFVIEDVIDDTTLIIDGDQSTVSSASGITAANVPEIPWRKKNRQFLVSGHSLSENNTTIVNTQELNRITVADTTGLLPGDILSIYVSGVFQQNGEVLRIVDDKITFKFNLLTIYPNGSQVKKQAISKVYINTKELAINDLVEIDNQTTGATFTISDESEFNITPSRNISVSFQFTAGSRFINLLTPGFDTLTELVKSRDFVKSIGDVDTLFTEVLKVESDLITLRTPYLGGSKITTLTYRSPAVISDDSFVTVDCTGKTDDNTPNGSLISRGPDIVKDLLLSAGLSDLMDLTSFTNASDDSPYSIGLSIPQDIESKTSPTIKSLVDLINATVSGALVINSQLKLAYSILDVAVPQTKDLRLISFDDVKSWSLSSKSGNLYKSVNVKYNFKDYGNNRQGEDFDNTLITSDYVTKFETSNKTDEIDLYTDNIKDATELGERYLYYNTLSQSEISLVSDLRLSDLSIGQKVILDLPRLYKRLGDVTSQFKVATIVGINITGKQMTVKVSDLGNLFNRSSIITNDSDVEYSVATSEEKLYSAYITDEDTLVDSDEQTSNTNLIF